MTNEYPLLILLQAVKDTFSIHSSKALAEAQKIKKEKEEAERRLKEIQLKKEQERLAEDFESASVTELTDQEADKLQEDLDKEKNTSKFLSSIIEFYQKNMVALNCMFHLTEICFF